MDGNLKVKLSIFLKLELKHQYNSKNLNEYINKKIHLIKNITNKLIN
jgi:hypothetical protein